MNTAAASAPGTRAYFDYPRFPYRPPADSARRAGARAAVAIAGAGPVGLAAALALARHGIAVTVFDPKLSVSEGSRAICIARHSMESLAQLGVVGRFLGKALPWTHGTTYYREQPVFRLAMPHSDDLRFHPMYNLQQQYIELFLAEAAMAEPLIDLRWGHRLAGLAQDDGQVRLDIDTPDGGYQEAASWLLAADGARSQTRQCLGLRLHGDAYEGRYVIADVRLASDYPTERRAYFDAAANPGATVLVHRQPDDIWRIDYQIEAGDDAAAALDEATVRERVGAIIGMLGERAPWTLEWFSLYTAYTLCLDDYRHGRVFFLGDAAHLVPIFGVRGLNSGFADAMNIAWKLALVEQGVAGPALLDSYTPERRGATLDIFTAAGRSTRFMTPPSRGQRRMRDAALGLAASHDFVRPLLDPRQSQPYIYADSPLTTSAKEEGCSAGPPPGAALPDRRIGPDQHILDVLGAGFTALYFPDERPNLVALLALAQTLPPGLLTIVVIGGMPATPAEHLPLIHVPDADGTLAAAFDAVHGGLYVVRPDRHVCARWRHVDIAAVRTALTRALGGIA